MKFKAMFMSTMAELITNPRKASEKKDIHNEMTVKAGPGQVVNPEAVEEHHDEDLEEHHAEEHVQLMAKKQIPVMSKAVCGYLNTILFKGDNKDQAIMIPDPPHLVDGVVMPIPPPKEWGILTGDAEQLTDILNQAMAKMFRSKFGDVMKELLENGTERKEETVTTEKHNFVTDRDAEQAKKMQALGDIHNVFKELTSKAPKLGLFCQNGEVPKKSEDIQNLELSHKWKKEFLKAMQDVLGHKKNIPEEVKEANNSKNILNMLAINMKQHHSNLMSELKEKHPEVPADIDHALKNQIKSHNMTIFNAGVEVHAEEDLEEHNAEEGIQLAPKKWFTNFNRAIGGLMGLVNKNWDKDASKMKIGETASNFKISEAPHKLSENKLGKNCGTKVLIKGPTK